MAKSRLARRNKKTRNAAWQAAHPNYSREYYAAHRAQILAEHVGRDRKSLLRKYGLSETTYSALLEKQRKRCAICHETFGLPNVDHDHKTGFVRGLLCSRCNIGLGALNDSLIIMRSAIRYLKEAAKASGVPLSRLELFWDRNGKISEKLLRIQGL